MSRELLAAIAPYLRDFIRRVNAAPGDAAVTSWIRTRAQNDRVGGDSASQHLIGTAADFVARGTTTHAALAASLRSVGLVVVDEGDHIHAQLFNAGAAGPFIRAAIARGWIA